MAAKISVKKVLVFLFWCLMASVLITLAFNAFQKREKEQCSGFEIKLKGDESLLFIDKKELTQLLSENGSLIFKGKPVSSFNLRKMEQKLEKNRWIENADLYFDNLQLLQVVVQERIPVARVFTSSGNSFYLDSSCVELPLSDKVTARLPLFTGFPGEEKKWKSKDSVLAKDVVALGEKLGADPFWTAQIAQVVITSTGEFELIPTLGNHIIELGDASDLNKKLAKLHIFYANVLAAKGLDAYERIKLQFKGQVVGVKKTVPLSRQDSIQAIRNVEELIRQAHEENLKTNNN